MYLIFFIHSSVNGHLSCVHVAAAAKSLQSCLTLCDHIDGSPPGSPVPGILQARTLEWVAISFSNAWKWKVKVKSLSCVRFFATPWTAAHQAPPSMGFSRQEYWSGHVTAIVNIAAMNIRVHVSFRIVVFSGCMPNSGIVGSHGSFIPSFLRNLHTVLQSGYINLYPHQLCNMVSFSPHLLRHLLFIDFLMVILTGMR